MVRRRCWPPRAPSVEEVGAPAWREGGGSGQQGRRGDISPEASAGPRLRVPARGRPRELALGLAVPEGGSDSFAKPAGRRRTGRPEPRHSPSGGRVGTRAAASCGPRALGDPRQGRPTPPAARPSSEGPGPVAAAAKERCRRRSWSATRKLQIESQWVGQKRLLGAGIPTQQSPACPPLPSTGLLARPAPGVWSL